jgi:MFS family permease
MSDYDSSSSSSSSSSSTGRSVELTTVGNPIFLTGDADNDDEFIEVDFGSGGGSGGGLSSPTRVPSDDAADDDDDDGDPRNKSGFGEGADLVEVRGFWQKLKRKVSHALYDPTLPREVQLFRRENVCIVLCYVLVGFFQGVTTGVMNVYPLELGATEAQQATIKVLRAFPATFKLVYGFISDAVPLMGYRRKGYMFLGWSLSSVAMALLTVTPVPTIPFLSFMYLLFGFGFWVADVMADALVAEKAKLEPEGSQGTLQSTCYAFRFFFLMIGVIIATYLYEVIDVHVIFATLALAPPAVIWVPWTWLYVSEATPPPFFSLSLFWVNGLPACVRARARAFFLSSFPPFLPPPARSSVLTSCLTHSLTHSHAPLPFLARMLSFFPSFPFLFCGLPNSQEERYAQVAPVRSQVHAIWKTVSSRSVFQPMAFVYLFNVVQFGNAAWSQYLYTVLEFSTAQLNSILVISEVLLFVGVVAYKQYMRGWSWRNVYWMVIIANCFFSVLQIMLIRGANRAMGIGDFWFALGDEAMVEFAAGVQFLPCTIMMVHLCPKGSEGVSYAMFTTMNNVALNLSSMLSTSLLGIWDVSKETMMEGDLSGLVKLTILTTCMQTSGCLFLPLLPKYKRDLEALVDLGHSRRAGIIFLTILGVSMLCMITTSFLNILAPG